MADIAGEDEDRRVSAERRVSSEIVALGRQMLNAGSVQKVVEDVVEDIEEREEREEEEGDQNANLLECLTSCWRKNEQKEKLGNLKKELNIDWHTKSLEQLQAEYGTKFVVNRDKDDEEKWNVPAKSIEGLSTSDADKLRDQYGLNRLTPPKTKPEWVKFCEQLTGFFSLLLWAGGILCFIGYGLQGAVDNLYLGIVLCVVVFLTGVFGYVQDKKSSDLMNSFKSMMPQSTQVVRNGQVEAKNALQIVPGDILKIKNGDKVPADVRIISMKGVVMVDNAALTGESEPQKRSVETTHANPLETKNLAFFGTSLVKGSCHGIVVATGDHTVMGRIAALASQTETEETPIAKEIHHFVKIVSGVAFVLGISFFIVGMLLGTDIITNLVFMIGIIVANVPEGLLATVTVCMALTSYRMATNNVLVKNLEGVETLGSTSCICSDKTGTLTQNDMTVDAACCDGKRYQARCGSKKEDPKLRTSGSFERLLRCATLCNNVKWDVSSRFRKKRNPAYKRNGTPQERGAPPFVADKSKPLPFMSEMAQVVDKQGTVIMIPKFHWKPLSDATECALAKFAQPINDLEEMQSKWEEIAQVPFNSTNKYQISVRHNPVTKSDGTTKPSDTVLIEMKGAPERVIGRCDKIWIDGKLVPFDAKRLAEVAALQKSCSQDGLRVLGFAEREMTGAEYKKFCGPAGTDGSAPSPKTFAWNVDKPNFPIGEPAGKNVHEDATEKLHFCGLFAMIDPERPQVPGAVAKCKTAGIRVIMVTGDHPETAKAIAKKVGIIWGDTDRGGATDGPATEDEYDEFNRKHGLMKEGDVADCTIQHKDGTTEVLKNIRYFDPRLAPAIVVPGWELEGNVENEAFWTDILAHTQIVFARTSPQQKLVIVENCQKTGEIVAVTGDGVNDAPALKKADIGVAMGIMGSDVSKEAADMILLDDNFASIVAGVEEGRLIFDNLKKSIAYTLSSNIPEIAPFICFITFMLPLPLSTVLILCVDLGTDMVPAISMAWENKESDIMKRPPREAGRDRLVTKKLVVFSYLQIGVIQAVAGFYTWFVVMYDYGYPAHILPGLGAEDAWGKRLLWCKPQDNSTKFRGYTEAVGTKTYADILADIAAGDGSSKVLKTHPFLDGHVSECTFAPRTFAGVSSRTGVDRDNWNWEGITNFNDREITPGGNSFMSETAARVMEGAGYVPYIPYRAVTSPFFRGNWMKMPFGKTLGAVGFGDAGTEVQSMYQPGGYFRLITSEYYSNTTKCNGHSECCGYTDSSNNFVMTVPYDEANTEFGGADMIFPAVEDIFNDASCQATFRCGSTRSNVVSVSCSSYDRTFTRLHEYRLDDDCNTTNAIPTFPTYETTCDKMMDNTACDKGHCANVASRNSMKETLHHAQCAYFVSIVIVQWADLVICKTRMNSIYHQGMLNPAMNYGLIFETLLAAILCYTPGLTFALGTRPLKFLHWMPGIPYSIFIFLYDETRKKIMRHQVTMEKDKQTGQIIRNPGWVERNTYY
eukprot:g3009.t1